MFITLHGVVAVLFFKLLATTVSGKGNTTCAGSALDWYTDAVGETPCKLQLISSYHCPCLDKYHCQ